MTGIAFVRLIYLQVTMRAFCMILYGPSVSKTRTKFTRRRSVAVGMGGGERTTSH